MLRSSFLLRRLFKQLIFLALILFLHRIIYSVNIFILVYTTFFLLIYVFIVIDSFVGLHVSNQYFLMFSYVKNKDMDKILKK